MITSQRPINVSVAHTALLRDMQETLAREQVIIRSVQMAMSALIQNEYGVDLTSEDWVLDLVNGTLSRKEDNAAPTPNTQ